MTDIIKFKKKTLLRVLITYIFIAWVFTLFLFYVIINQHNEIKDLRIKNIELENLNKDLAKSYFNQKNKIYKLISSKNNIPKYKITKIRDIKNIDKINIPTLPELPNT